MNKIAFLGMRLVGLLLLTPLCYVVASVLAGDRPLTRAGGTIVAFLPPVVVAIASMYTIYHALYAEKFGRAGKTVFHLLNLVASLLLAAFGALIAFGVQVALFGE
jgi:hypothetical protein